MTTQTEEPTTKRDQLVAVIATYKKTNKDYSTLAAFLYVKNLTAYSDDNCILILEQCQQRAGNPFDLEAIKGFSAWLDVGRVVRKGQKCFYILAPLVRRDDERGDSAKRETVFGYKCAFVFDVSQTDEMTAEERAAHAAKSAAKQDAPKHDTKRTKGKTDTKHPRGKSTAEERERNADEARRQAEREAADRERARHIFEEWEREQARANQRRQQSTRRGTLGMTDSEARAILGIAGDLTAATLRTAYRRAARANHPDRGGSEETMKRINRANDYLKAYVS